MNYSCLRLSEEGPDDLPTALIPEGPLWSQAAFLWLPVFCVENSGGATAPHPRSYALLSLKKCRLSGREVQGDTGGLEMTQGHGTQWGH